MPLMGQISLNITDEASDLEKGTRERSRVLALIVGPTFYKIPDFILKIKINFCFRQFQVHSGKFVSKTEANGV